jgi:hypothetical protein
MRTPVWFRTRAAEIGEDTAAVIAELLAVNALFRLHAAQGVLGLADKYGPARLEAACGKALLVGDPTYRTGNGGAAAFLSGTPSASWRLPSLANIASWSVSASCGEAETRGAVPSPSRSCPP